jgi:hypothetical protein
MPSLRRLRGQDLTEVLDCLPGTFRITRLLRPNLS